MNLKSILNDLINEQSLNQFDKSNCVKQEGNKKIFERYTFEVHILTKKITMDQEDGWFLNLPDSNGEPETPGWDKNGQEESISKETASKDDQKLRKSLQLFWEPLHPWNYLALSNFDRFLKEDISDNK